MFVEKFRKTSTLVATLLLGCILIGCDKGDSVPPVDPASPASYMKDTNFMAKVDAREAKGNALRARHMKLREEIEALKAKEPASPKLAALEKELSELQAAFQANRQEMLAIVRERITPKAPQKKNVEQK